MVATSIILALLCVVLSWFLLFEEREKAKLAEQYGLMKGRVEVHDEAAPSEKEEKEENKLPSSNLITLTSIRAALRFNGFFPESVDESEPNIVYFKIDDTNFRVNAERLPLLSVEVGYSLEEAKENIDLLRDAASEVTARLFISKAVIVGEEAKAVIYSTEFICGAYAYLRDNLKEYLNCLREAGKLFNETYDSLKEKRKEEREAVFSGQSFIQHPPPKKYNPNGTKGPGL